MGGRHSFMRRNGGHGGVVRYLVDAGAKIHHRDHFGWTVLQRACFQGDARVVSLLLQRGADITAVNVSGATALMQAARAGRDTVVRLLLEYGGSDLDASDSAGWTAMRFTYHAGVLRQLLEAGADPTLCDNEGRTPLSLAVRALMQNLCRILEAWYSVYTLRRARTIRDASNAI